jgi:uncharacterized protein (DUF1501 family)
MTHAHHPHCNLTRRSLLAAGGLGLSLELIARPGFAASDPAARRKTVVILCRGAMDGLSVSPPLGDANYLSLRREIAIPAVGQPNGALAYNADFALHPKLKAVAALAARGQARIAPAIAIPDRARSHFEAQDVLESGANAVYGATSGWLNRSLAVMGPGHKVQAISVGAQAPLILRGKEVTASWSPGKGLGASPRLPDLLADLYAGDPQLSQALASGLRTESMVDTAMQEAAAALAMDAGPMNDSMTARVAARAAPVTAQGVDGARKIGSTLAGLLNQPDGPSIAAISLDGFDTHANQGAADGQLANRLIYLDAVIDGLQTGLGPSWNDTVVIVATEFGRTARINGTRGTDHGTASTALLLGGGLKKGGIIGDWPGLTETALYQNRDLAPTLDMRSLFKGVLADQYGISARDLDTLVFPDSAAAPALKELVA